MARPKPQTEFHVSYGAVTLNNNADALLPVFIAPRYAVHSSIYSNAQFNNGAVYSGSSMTAEWPFATSGAVVDTLSAEVIVTSPTVALSSVTPKATSTGGAVVFSGAVVGSSTVFQDNYSLRIGDQLVIGGSAYSVQSIGQSTDNGSAVLVGGVGMSGGAAYNGVTSAVYVLSATSASASGSAVVTAVAAAGDPGYSATVTLVTGSATNIGTLGATVTPGSLSAGALSAGETFILSCTGGTVGAYDTVYINTEGTPTSGATVVRTSNLIATGSAQVLANYWSAGPSNVLVSANAQCTYANGTYPIVSGGLEVNYRELLTDDVNVLVTGAEASGWVGELTPGNPLGEAYKAAVQTGYNDFFVMATAADTDDAYEAAFAALTNQEQVYQLVPIRQTANVIAAMLGVIAENSKPTVARMKRGWIYSQVKPNTVVLTTTATAADDVVTFTPTEAGSILVGDTVEFPNVGSGVVTEVNTTSGVVTVDEEIGTLSTAAPVIVYRKRNHTQLAQAIAAEAMSYNNSRINYVYAEPNTVATDSFEDARYIIPVLATMRATMAPHAPLTDVPIPGVSIGTGIGFTESDLDLMNNAGVWICYRDGRGEMVTRHAITTGGEGTIAEEDSAVSNGDNIIRTVRNQVSWLRGNCNVTPALIDKLYTTVQAALSAIQGRNYDALIGPQILEVTSVDIKQDPNNTAGVIGRFDIDLPDVYLNGDFTFNLF